MGSNIMESDSELLMMDQKCKRYEGGVNAKESGNINNGSNESSGP